MKTVLKIFFLYIIFLNYYTAHASRHPVLPTKIQNSLNPYYLYYASLHQQHLQKIEEEKKVVNQDFFSLTIGKIYNNTNANLVIGHNKSSESEIKFGDKLLLNSKLHFFKSLFYDDLSRECISKYTKNIKIDLDEIATLGKLSVWVDNSSSDWYLKKCKQCNESKLNDASCINCMATSEKFKDKKIVVDFKFFEKDDRLRVYYKVR